MEAARRRRKPRRSPGKTRDPFLLEVWRQLGADGSRDTVRCWLRHWASYRVEAARRRRKPRPLGNRVVPYTRKTVWRQLSADGSRDGNSQLGHASPKAVWRQLGADGSRDSGTGGVLDRQDSGVEAARRRRKPRLRGPWPEVRESERVEAARRRRKPRRAGGIGPATTPDQCGGSSAPTEAETISSSQSGACGSKVWRQLGADGSRDRLGAPKRHER